jgi:hypothetical protein
VFHLLNNNTNKTNFLCERTNVKIKNNNVLRFHCKRGEDTRILGIFQLNTGDIPAEYWGYSS